MKQDIQVKQDIHIKNKIQPINRDPMTQLVSSKLTLNMKRACEQACPAFKDFITRSLLGRLLVDMQYNLAVVRHNGIGTDFN